MGIRRITTWIVGSVVLLAAAGCASSPARPGPAYRLKRVASPPADLSARIDRAPWTCVPDLSPMTLVGTPGLPPTVRTRVKACWSDRAIRILWYCEDSDVIAHFSGRDEKIWKDDVVEVFLCPTGDRTRYFEINFNARGALFDAMIRNPALKRGPDFVYDTSWNCAGIRWHAAGQGRFSGTANQDRWWAVEAEIPFAGLGVAVPTPGDAWVATANRIDLGPPEQWCSWSAMPEHRYGLHQSDRFGIWIFEP